MNAESSEQALPTLPTTDPAAAAFFDVDNTIMRGASVFQLARGMYARKYFGWRDVARMIWEELVFRTRGENLHQIDQVQARALTIVAGRRVEDVRQLGQEVYDELMADRIWPGAYALAHMHLDAGQRVWLVTATPAEVAEVIAARLGLTGALATIAESHDGIYTGRLVGGLMHGQYKADAIAELARTQGLDLSRCTAYSDSINDLPMLTLVGTPVAVNPDAALRAYAKQRGWTICDYRSGWLRLRTGVPLAAVALIALGAGAAARSRRAQRN